MLDHTHRKADEAAADEAYRRLVCRIAARRPRVHCITNAVVQSLTANALVAIGAEPVMAVHPSEIIAVAGRADAVLVNLGTLDPVREAAIEALMSARLGIVAPLVLDPVMVDLSSFRRVMAERFLDAKRLIVKGNQREMAVMAPHLRPGTIRVTTGKTDRIVADERQLEVSGGHPYLARVSGSGCLAGALIAAFAAVEPDSVFAAQSALRFLRESAADAGANAGGPGTFLPLLIDAFGARTDCCATEERE
jgi:hydroxyethylthiazole kinase